MLALSIFAFTTSSKSSALSMPVAENDSTSFGAPSSLGALTAPKPPPAAIAPGPAGFTSFFAGTAFFVPAFGAALALVGAEASSSARSRAFSALRASSARRRASLSSDLFDDLAPWDHLSASFLS